MSERKRIEIEAFEATLERARREVAGERAPLAQPADEHGRHPHPNMSDTTIEPERTVVNPGAGRNVPIPFPKWAERGAVLIQSTRRPVRKLGMWTLALRACAVMLTTVWRNRNNIR